MKFQFSVKNKIADATKMKMCNYIIYDSNYIKDIRKRNIEYFYPFFIFLEKPYDIENP